ncbi:MAG TPA: PIN domain-containing protein [Gemmatimonadota bacterium]|nr:PIN domain-containing protein [Gemmatimonadota bacterium]
MVVLDSSFLVAFFNATDALHARAAAAMERLAAGEWGETLLPEYVVLEVLTVIAARLDHASAIGVGTRLLGQREIAFVPCSEHFTAGFEEFRRQPALSFADAAIVAIARRHGARILAFDADFRQVEGVDLLP